MKPAAPPRCLGCGHTPSRADAKFCSRCGRPLANADPKRRKTKDVAATEGDQAAPEAVSMCRARCSRSRQPFIIKFVQGSRGFWFARSSWVVSEKRIEGPIFESGTIRGRLVKHREYPGCPYCPNDLWRYCFTCNRGFGCIERGSPSYVCPWCGEPSTPKWDSPSGRAIRVRAARD